MSRAVPTIDVVKREDKETRLKSFIETAIVATVGDDGRVTRYLAGSLVARSTDSPVVRALAAIARAEPDLIVAARTVLMAPDADRPAVGDAIDTFAVDVRIVADQRLLNAHEQLVLGATTSWIGDCMRRDPTKRDAYECFAADCPTTTRWARTAFERIWTAAKPFRRTTVAKVALPAACDEAGPSGDGHEAPPQLEPPRTSTAATRH